MVQTNFYILYIDGTELEVSTTDTEVVANTLGTIAEDECEIECVDMWKSEVKMQPKLELLDGGIEEDYSTEFIEKIKKANTIIRNWRVKVVG